MTKREYVEQLMADFRRKDARHKAEFERSARRHGAAIRQVLEILGRDDPQTEPAGPHAVATQTLGSGWTIRIEPVTGP